MERVIEALKKNSDACIVLHEPGQFSDNEIAAMGLGEQVGEEIIDGKRIRYFSIRVDRSESS